MSDMVTKIAVSVYHGYEELGSGVTGVGHTGLVSCKHFVVHKPMRKLSMPAVVCVCFRVVLSFLVRRTIPPLHIKTRTTILMH